MNAVSAAPWRLFTSVRVVCGTRVVLVASLGFPPLCLFFLFFAFVCFFKKREQKRYRTRENYRHRHGQLGQRCSSALFLIVVCVAGVFLAVAPQGCGSRLLMSTGAC